MTARISTRGRSPSQRALRALLNQKTSRDDLVFRLSGKLFAASQSPVAQRLFAALQNKDWDTLVSAYVDPNEYSATADYFFDKQCESLLRKYPFPGREALTKAKALETFHLGEKACAETNELLRCWDHGQVSLLHDADAAIYAARWKISSILGNLEVNEWLASCSFGPGSVSGVAGTSDYAKLSSSPTVTEELYPFAEVLLKECPAWFESLTYGREALSVRSYPGGTYSQVPKDAKTNRNIEVQPLLNAYLQSGLGKLTRRKLLRVGINLNDQTRNQELARQGSISGFWATIDLSNASDTISSNLVRLLLPNDWLHAMELTRTHRIKLNEVWQHLHRFSSMGNGFTFELESLIFWALCKVACESCGYYGPIAVYGDDIIVPTHCFSRVSSVLTVCGFAVNVKKSFASGPFRESCGADWFNGINVRPLFIKENPQDVASLISLANGLKRAASRSNRGFGYDRRFAAAWYVAIRGIPVAVRRNLAFGFTDVDDFVLSGRPRDGLSIHFISRQFRDLNWYPAKATALYRVDRRSRPTLNQPEVERVVRFDHRASDVAFAVFGKLSSDWLPSGGSLQDSFDGHIFDYRRDCGEWRLRKAGSVISRDPTALWW